MAGTTTGTSGSGLQRLVGFGNITIAQFQIRLTATPTGNPNVIGFYYVKVKATTTPFQEVILAAGKLYTPGQFITFPNQYGFSNYTYALDVQWNRQGLAWGCDYY